MKLKLPINTLLTFALTDSLPDITLTLQHLSLILPSNFLKQRQWIQVKKQPRLFNKQYRKGGIK